MESKTVKILAIDDNQDNLITIKALVCDTFPNAKVYTALSGKTGIELAKEEIPDVILLDVIMPGMDGFEVCEKLKADTALVDIPVVFVTAIKDDKENRIHALEVGADAFLTKPIDVSELTAQIRAMLKVRDLNVQKRNENLRLAALVAEQTQELKETHKATLKLLAELRTENEARKRTEKALRESEELYRSIINSSPDIIVITNVDAQVLMFSPQFLLQFGFDEKELIGRCVFDFIAKEDRQRFQQNFSEMLKGANIGAGEYRSAIFSQGHFADLELNGATIRNAEGQIDKLVFIVRDISERKVAQVALRESERQFRLITEKISDVVWLLDLSGKYIFVSPSIENFTGYTVDEYLSQPFENFFTPKASKDAIRTLQEVYTLYQKPGFLSQEYKKVQSLEYRCKDGNLKIGEQLITPYYDDNGELIGIHGVTRDVTEAKRAEEALKASEALYRSVLTASPDDINVTDLEGNIIMASPVVYKLIGYTKEEIVGRNLLELLMPDEVERAKAELLKVKSAGYSSLNEFHIRRADGSVVDVEINAEYVRNESSIPTGMVIIIRDITERKIAEEKLRHVARLYALLGQISQVIVRVSESNELFERICQTAVEYGQFQMAWIAGLMDDGYSITQITNFGNTDGFFESFTQGINLESPGFVPEVFGKGEMRYCNDIASEPVMQSWREEALKRRYHSSIYVPLRQNGKVIAVLCLYSSDIGFFSTEEQCLLNEIGEDVSFALDAIDSEYQRNQAELALEQSRAELKAIYDNAPVMMCLVNPERQVLFTNRAFDTFTKSFISSKKGNRDVEIMVGGLLGCVNVADAANVCGSTPGCVDCSLRKAILTTFETGVGQADVEYHGISTVGDQQREVYLLVSTALIQTADQPSLLLCLSDITARKLAEEAVQKSEMLLRSFVDNIPFEVWARDNNSIGILENKKFIDHVGSIIGRTPRMQPDISDETLEIWESTYEYVFNGGLFQGEYVSQIGSEERIFQNIVFPVKIEDRIIGIAGVNIDITDRKRAEDALLESREELKNFAVHLQNVREEERTLLAREIHDELGQILVAVKIDMGMLKQNVFKRIDRDCCQDVLDKFDDLSRLIDNTLKTSRRIMTNLRPDVLDLLGFDEAVKQLLHNFEKRFNVICRFYTSVSNIKFNPQQSVALFRIIQEALNNTAKYAQATKVNVDLTLENSRLLLEIADDGVGFDVNAKRRADSYGLIGMKERVCLLEGELDIISAPGQGTRILVKMNYDGFLCSCIN